ncbi:MAG TPA: transcriptional regulator [Pyrinomonadaceae bacterium]|nr:transcriptional regulator [Pyrinomonadaceae bacterium]
MSRRNLALAEDAFENLSEKEEKARGARIRKVERAAETVSNDLDKVIHERMRLGIISALVANESLTFNDLKKLLQTTDGNVSVHARKLEEAGYIECFKSFQGRMPLTEYKITAAGRKALESYLNHMEALVKAMKAI